MLYRVLLLQIVMDTLIGRILKSIFRPVVARFLINCKSHHIVLLMMIPGPEIFVCLSFPVCPVSVKIHISNLISRVSS